MKFYIFILTIVLNAVISSIAFSQKKDIAKLLLLLGKEKEDTARVNTLNALAAEFRYTNTDTAMYYSSNALSLATKLNYEMGIADSKMSLSSLFASQGKFDEGIRYGNEALATYNRLLAFTSGSDKEKILAKIANTYQNIGHNTISQGNYPEGLKNSLLSLKIKEQLGDKKGISDIKFNLGNLYSLQHNSTEALKYYNASLKISEELGLKSDIALTYNTIGWVYFQQANYRDALKQCLAALKLAEEVKESATLAEVYNMLGLVYNNLGNYSEALKYDFKSVKLNKETGIYQQLPDIYNNMGLAYLRQKKYSAASKYLGKALFLSKQIGSLELIKWSYENWALLDSMQGNYKKALVDYKLAVLYHDSLFNKENSKKLVQQQMQFDFDKKEAAAKEEQEKKEVLAVAEIQNQKNIRNFSIAGIIAVICLSAAGFYQYKRKKLLQNQQAIANERLRISQELHDEVGATLSGIAMYSHLAKEQIKNPQAGEIENSLSIIQSNAGEMVNKLNDIVWLINPGQDSLQQLMQRLEDYAIQIAAVKNIRVKSNINGHHSANILPAKTRRNIYLLFKEAINNAVKYSNATLLELYVKEQNNEIEISLKDDGDGFDVDEVRRGNGLDNMKNRAAETGASFSLQSRAGTGTSISLCLKNFSFS
ncbi:MAG: tetratricopeptide repeat protein [Chitinophagaceae bacterium]|nr:tetratricopeptide repeat protein [Chitinophagaceae bacterium]